MNIINRPPPLPSPSEGGGRGGGEMSMEIKEKIIEKVLLLVALSSIAILGLITFFIFEEGLPLIWKVGPKAFIFGQKWIPSKGLFGIFPMIISSFWVTFGALLLGIPLGLACTIFLSELIPPSIGLLLRPKSRAPKVT